MDIYGKRAFNIEQIKAGLAVGLDKIEIQLLGELFDKEGKSLPAESVFNLDALSQFDIYAIHTPLFDDNDTNIENVTFGEPAKMFNECCYIAEYIAQKKNRDILVVVHSCSSIERLKALGDNWERVVNIVGVMLIKYPHIHIAIENVTPFRYPNYHALDMTNGFKFSNVRMAVELQKVLCTDRVGTVLDTCHVLMSQKYLKAMYELINEKSMPMENVSFEKFFQKNASTCKLIHLAGMRGNGFNENHGVPFTQDSPQDMALLKEIIDLYDYYDYHCPITLEVQEPNYLTPPVNYIAEKQALKYILNS